MTVADLIEKRSNYFSIKEKMLKCALIALDGKDGKILFDTSRHKKEKQEQYYSGEVISLWADVRLRKGVAFNDYFEPVMKCYVSHDSWKRGSNRHV